MPDPQGCFVWYELMTTDTEGARAFYGQVVGWGTQDAPGGLPYTLFTTGEMPVAGLMDLPEEARAMGAPPGWIGSSCLSRTSANPKTEPSATATPGTSRTVSTMLSSSGRTCPPLLVMSASYAGSDFTTTSVPEVRPV